MRKGWLSLTDRVAPIRRNTQKLIASLSFIVLFILSMLLNARVDFLSRALALCVNFLLHICGAIVAFLLLQYLANRVKWEESKAFLKLSDRMMPMYLIHQQVIYFSIILLNGKINPYMNALVNFGVAMIISYVISGILLVPLAWRRVNSTTTPSM